MSTLRVFALLFCIGLVSFESNEDIVAFNYIEAYQELAVVEMYRTGIPASITLAQALHESHFGTSRLAKEANNHFGIKCKSYWTGRTFYHKDDDYNKRGELIESCFRAYDTDIESYIDRSNFLMFSERYMPLFSFDKTDYKSWAYGLKYCGYATDPQYSEKLIRQIERYNLDIYDTSEDPFRRLIKK